MLAKRIIPCLDVNNNKVIKGIKFRNHKIIGDIIPLAQKYSQEGADELVFYDITASSDNRTVEKKWISLIAKEINIPFCVAGGIKSINDAKKILESGADKISINSPAISDPNLITKLANQFGIQCIVVGIDSWYNKKKKKYYVNQYTGNIQKTITTKWETFKWIEEVQNLGAGEIVLNMINQDGMRQGYDLIQLKKARKICKIPLIASGGAGNINHFYEVFHYANVDGALAASVFHKKIIKIINLKKFLLEKKMEIRLC